MDPWFWVHLAVFVSIAMYVLSPVVVVVEQVRER